MFELYQGKLTTTTMETFKQITIGELFQNMLVNLLLTALKKERHKDHGKCHATVDLKEHNSKW